MGVTATEAILRMGAAMALAVPIGFERERNGHPAGLRTHLLAGLAGAILMLVSTRFADFQGYEKGGVVEVDASRIAGGAVQGIGFLGGGAILRMGANVKGLTTAASLWTVSALGLCAGGGMFAVGAAGCVATIGTLVLLARFEKKTRNWHQWRFTVILEGGQSPKGVLEALRASGAEVLKTGHARDFQVKTTTLSLEARLRGEEAVEQALSELEKVPGVQRVTVEEPG